MSPTDSSEYDEEEYKAIVEDHTFTKDPKSTKNGSMSISHYVLSSDGALQHAVAHREELESVLIKYSLPTDFTIQAGFNEDLLVNYNSLLQEVYIVCEIKFASLQPACLKALEIILSPYPAYIVTTSGATTPIFNTDSDVPDIFTRFRSKE